MLHAKETICLLNRLVRVCRDSEAMCECGAARAASDDLRGLLLNRSEEWARRGDELQALVLLLGGAPAVSVSFAARARRLKLALRMTLNLGSDASVVEEWQRARKEALCCYAEALDSRLPERIRRTIGLQAERIMGRSGQITSSRVQFAIPATSS